MDTGFSLKLPLANVGLLVALTCMLPSPAAAQGKGDAAVGRVLAEERCANCHGLDGNGNKAMEEVQRGLIARISGQPEPYFIKSMREYKRHQRPDQGMQIYAQSLSDQDFRNAAAWYASQLPSATPTYSKKRQ